MTFSSLNTNKLQPKPQTYYSLPVTSIGTTGQFVYDSNGIRYLVIWFTSSGTFSISTGPNRSASLLVVGGGAGGGGNGSGWGGDSTAGGNSQTDVTLTTGATYTVTVGGGGGNGNPTGANGGSSSVSGTGVSITVTGGTGSGFNYAGAYGTPALGYPYTYNINGPTGVTVSSNNSSNYGSGGRGYHDPQYASTSGTQGVVVARIQIGTY